MDAYQLGSEIGTIAEVLPNWYTNDLVLGVRDSRGHALVEFLAVTNAKYD